MAQVVRAPDRVFALVLIGPPGAGKTSVPEALSDALVDDDLRHATIETEALTSAHPALDDEAWFVHVRAACALYRKHGFAVLLVAATVESDADLRGLLAAVAAEEHVVVRLEAEPATLAERIAAREPPGWSGLEALIEASARLTPVVAGLAGVALALSTDGQRAGVVAARIRDAFPSVLGPAHE
jgi:predicted kinase